MVSERLQRRIDSLLDEADEAVAAEDWDAVSARCRSVLALDPDNVDATEYLAAAKRSAVPDSAQGAAAAPTTEPETTPAPSHPSSFVAGRYRVERFLGEGGRKRVFLAHDTTLDRDIAFAQIRTEGLDDLARERVMREAQSMARLGAHPNLVAIHDIGEEGGNPHLVEEYMAGGTVASLLEEGTPDVERTLAVATDVCRALSFMHGQGLIHRDLKPANIFLTEDGHRKGRRLRPCRGAGPVSASRSKARWSARPPTCRLSRPSAARSRRSPTSTPSARCSTNWSRAAPPFAGDDPTAVISQHINTPPVAPSWHTEACPPSLEAAHPLDAPERPVRAT